MRKLFFTLGLCLVIAWSFDTTASGPHGTQPGWAIDNSGNVLITTAVADRLAQSGAGWVRINFRLGPHSSDTPAFYAAYDTVINRLRSRGLQVLGVMSNESWPGGQTDWTANNWENASGDGYNNYIDAFGYAFGRIADHFEGRIERWEIWNEPNCWNSNPAPGVYTGGSFIYPSNFAAMLAHCHSQVRYYNNLNVKIVSGGLFGHDIGGFNTGSAGIDYLNDTYDVGINHTGKFAWTMNTYGTYPLDAIGYHIYINQGGAVSSSWFGTYLDWVNNTINTWEGSGSGKKVWLSEFGWTTASVSESTQSSNLNAAFGVVQTKSFVESALWFQMEDNQPGNMYYGLFRPNLSKKPSWTTFNTRNTYQGKRSNGATVTAILNKYNSSGGLAANGSPFDNGGSVWAHWWDYGYVQDFKGGSVGPCAIFDTGYRVQAGFWQAYLQGNNHHHLKLPTSDEFAWGSGTRQNFQGGYMTWDPVNGVLVF